MWNIICDLCSVMTDKYEIKTCFLCKRLFEYVASIACCSVIGAVIGYWLGAPLLCAFVGWEVGDRVDMFRGVFRSSQAVGLKLRS